MSSWTEQIASVGLDLPRDGAEVVDASGAYVIPGGIDVHTHFEMPFGGTVSCETFETGTKAAAVGGTTMVVDFAMQAPGDSLMKTYSDWRAMADDHVVVDYGLHMAITDLTEDTLAEIPLLVEEGVASLKVFMAYKGAIMVDDATLLRTLKKGKECGALVCVHAENGDVIDVLVNEHLAAGKTAPKYHLSTRLLEAEAEATRRAIMLPRSPMPPSTSSMSPAQALDEIRAAKDRGQTAMVGRAPVPGSFWDPSMCPALKEPSSSAPRRFATNPMAGLWSGVRTGSLSTVASDHAAFNYADRRRWGSSRGSTRCPTACPAWSIGC